MARINRQALASWLFLGLLATVALVIGFLQYHWLGEVSAAERERLRSSLQTALSRVAEEFDSRIATVALAVVPVPGATDVTAREREWADGFARVGKSGNGHMLRALYVTRPVNDGIALRRLDPRTGVFQDAEWPSQFAEIRERLLQRMNHVRGPMGVSVDSVVEAPYFASDGRGPRGPTEWGLIELDRGYLASKLVPELLDRQLGGTAIQDYDFRVTARANDNELVYASSDAARDGLKRPDAAVEFFTGRPIGRFGMGGFGGPPPGDEGRPRRFDERPPGEPRRTPPEFRGGGKGEPGRFGPGPHGRWILEARSRAGSLESLVEKARMRNLFVISALLTLIVAAGFALTRYARRAQQLADMQIEFVAGVSHELRTPLAVMRTAGYNLAHAAPADPARIRQYGELVQTEAERLSRIVDEVLGFSKAQAGRVIGPVAPVPVGRVIDEAAADSHTDPERSLEAGLPPVLADEHALKHALQNLLSNAAKYGGDWIGVTARANGRRVEIAVADHGRGIPADEIPQIFEPFYRGRQAVSDQIHGTGLGLSLVKRIVEAHNGTISVRSKEGSGAEFVISIPAAHEAANPAG